MRHHCFIICLMASLCYGTAYYVDAEHGNNSNTGMSEGEGNAWATISYAIDHADTGDVDDIIYVRGANDAGSQLVYSEQLDFTESTHAGEIHVLIAYNAGDHQPRIAPAANYAVHCNAVSTDVTVSLTNFEIEQNGAYNYPIYLNGDGVFTFTNCTLKNATGTANTYISRLLDTGASLVLDSCTIEWGSRVCYVSAGCNNVTIRDCTVTATNTSTSYFVELNAGVCGDITIVGNTVVGVPNMAAGALFTSQNVTEIGNVKIMDNVCANMTGGVLCPYGADYMLCENNQISIDDSSSLPVFKIGIETSVVSCTADAVVQDGPLVKIPVSSVLYFVVGMSVDIAGTTNYDGTFDIVAIDGASSPKTISITSAFTAETLSTSDTVTPASNPYPFGKVVISNNMVDFSSGSSKSHSAMLGLGTDGLECYGNFFSGGDYQCVVKGNYSIVYNNIFVGANCLYFSGPDNSVAFNNTCYATSGWAFSLNIHQGTGDQINPYRDRVYNNIFIGDGALALSIPDGFTAFNDVFVNYNCYWRSDSTTFARIGSNEINTLAELQAFWGGLAIMFDDDNDQDSIVANPQLDANYRPQINSPCVNARYNPVTGYVTLGAWTPKAGYITGIRARYKNGFVS